MISESSRLSWTKSPFRELVRLAWPITISMLSYSAMTLAGTLFVGRISAAALAAVGLGGIAAFTVICFGFGLLRSVKVLVSQAVGAERTEQVSGYVGAGIAAACGLGIVALVGGHFLAQALPGLTQSSEAGELAGVYLQIRNLGAPFALVAVALREARYGLGDSRSPMIAAVVANVTNVALDAALIFGLGLGVSGAAWATVVSHALEVALLLRASRSSGLGLRSFDMPKLAAVWRLGLPLGLQFLLEVGAFAVLVVILARIGEVDLAAHQIALQLCHFSFLPAFALGEAASVLSGQAVGAGADRLVRPVGRLALIAASVYTGACGIAFAVFAPLLAAAFTDEPAVRALAVRLIYVAAVFQIFDGANIVARCVLRGTGDVRVPAAIAVVTSWVCTPPLTLLLGVVLGLGAFGGWLGLCLEIVAGSAILWWRLERNHWVSAARRSREELEQSTRTPVPLAELGVP
jgi:multidrug resistance protein, MATE family